MNIIRKILKILVPWPGVRNKLKTFVVTLWIKDKLNRLSEAYLIATAPKRHQKALKKLKEKSKFKVVFLLLFESVWKYEGVYRLMEQEERFDPAIVICPYIAYGEETMFKEMDKAFKSFSQGGYNVKSSYNSVTGEWLDIKKDINPDIVFFTSPHPSSTKEQYDIKNFLDSLTCYVPYTFQTTFHYLQNYNRLFHNCLWKAYYQTIIHHRIAIKYSRNKGINVVVTGYPGIDNFFAGNMLYSNNEKSKSKKNVIWAPHHTFDGEGLDLNFSNFLRYYNFMIEIAKEYRDKLFIIFKPHPLLRVKLNKIQNWGIKKTDLYYRFWEENDFCALREGDYQLLFEESDAMIHDCDSFMGEYLALNKPVLYTFKDPEVKDRMNEFGKAAYDVHYKAENENDILDFINNVVINEKDEMKQLRGDWVKTIIVPPNSLTASMNIFVDLKKSLNIN